MILPKRRPQAYQAQRLSRLLASALVHSPYHAERIRGAGLDEAAMAGTLALADLASLPTMTKRDARDHVEQLVWRGVPGGVFPYTPAVPAASR